MTKEQLKQARHDLGLTQAAMAKLLKTSISTYRNWEQGVSPVPGPVEVLVKSLK